MMFSTTTGSRCALVWQIVVLSVVVLAAGCAGEKGEKRTGMASGKVTLDDAPVSAGTLLFMGEDGHGDSAELGAGGTYSLQLRPGTYKVSVSPAALPDPMAAPEGGAPKTGAEAVAIPEKYCDVGTSGLTAEVKEGDSSVDISMTSK